nr:MAG TPA: hypothetical protein [Caudoviricetes sp.]
METKELMKARAEQSMHCLLEKIDKVCDEARDGGGLSSEDVRTLEKAWCAVATIKAVCKE